MSCDDLTARLRVLVHEASIGFWRTLFESSGDVADVDCAHDGAAGGQLRRGDTRRESPATAIWTNFAGRVRCGMLPSLTPRERALLKARAHALEPVVQIGASGASDSAVAEVDRSLAAHGLIKVRLVGADRARRLALTEELCARTGAAAVQTVGRVLVLWRPRPEDAPLDARGDSI